MTSRTTLAHLSDIHLPFGWPKGFQWLSKSGLSALSYRRRRKKHLPEIAEILLDNLVNAKPDLITMGGDLINFGTKQEFEASKSFLEKLGPPEKVVAVPGNHEALVAGWRKHIRLWGDYASLSDNQEPALRIHGNVGLIAVSTALATPPFLASGKVGEKNIALAGALVAKAHKQNLCPVILMHHPPTPITSRRKGLSDYKAFCAEMKKANPALILHGHTHHAELSSIKTHNRVIPVLGIPSFSLICHNQSYSGAWRMIDIKKETDDWIITVTEHTVDDNKGLHALTPIRFMISRDNQDTEIERNI